MGIITSELTVSRTMTIAELSEVSSAIVQTQAHEAVSKKYTFVPTTQIIEDLGKLGWKPVSAGAVKSRKNKGYEKHRIVFQNPDFRFAEGDTYLFPQLVFQNSHDRSSGIVFDLGCFRQACGNGLFIKTKDFGGFSIRHNGYSLSVLREKILDFVKNAEHIVNHINVMKSRILTDEEKADFALKAVSLRSKGLIERADVDSILEVTRDEDKGNDLWIVFNRIQEKLINGGFKVVKGRKPRSITSLNKDTELNKKLFDMAQLYLN